MEVIEDVPTELIEAKAELCCPGHAWCTLGCFSELPEDED